MIGVGCDIERIDRFNEILKNKEFLLNIFTDREIQYCFKKRKPQLYLARKFASKEAVFKALSSLGHNVALKFIEILNQDEKPDIVRIRYNRIGKGYRILLDVAGTKEIVVASSIAQKISG